MNRLANILCLGCVLLFGAHPLSSVADANQANQLTIAIGRDFFDGPDSRTYLHGSTNTWEALTYLDEQLRAIPWLASSWEHLEDGRVWIFHLRQDVRFHDGTPLTAKDAAASITRIQASPKYDPSGVYRRLQAIETPDEHTILFRLDRPTPSFPNMIAYYSSPVLKPSTFMEDGQLTTLIGTGPYRLDHIQRGQFVSVAAFDEYWGAPADYRRVVFQSVPDAQTRIMALMAGNVDVVADVGAILPQQAPILEQSPEAELKRVEVATTHYLYFNCTRAPFQEQTYRAWLNGLLDRQMLIDHFVLGAGRIAKDLYTPLAKDWAFGNFQPATTDVLQSSITQPLRLVVPSAAVQRWPYLEIAQVLQERLRSQGIALHVHPLEPGAFNQALKERDFDLAMGPNTLMTGDPDFFYSYYLAPEGPFNFGCHTPESDALVLEARFAMDKSVRQSKYRKLAEWCSSQLPLLPLYHDISLYAHRRGVSGFSLDPFFRPRLNASFPN